MNFTDLFKHDEERAVSPVIGVILMVAITVILAAVIGTFVLGLGDQVQQTSPNAQWDTEHNATSETVNITHTSGDSVPASRLSASGSSINGDAGDLGNDTLTGVDKAFPPDVTAGDTAAVNVTSSPSGSVQLVWTAEGGGSSSTLTTYEFE